MKYGITVAVILSLIVDVLWTFKEYCCIEQNWFCACGYVKIFTWKKRIWLGQTSYIAIPGQRCFELISSHQQGIYTHSLSSAPPVYIQWVHQNASGSVVSELMIHHVITYVVPAMPRVINLARPYMYMSSLSTKDWMYSHSLEIHVHVHVYSRSPYKPIFARNWEQRTLMWLQQ